MLNCYFLKKAELAAFMITFGILFCGIFFLLELRLWLKDSLFAKISNICRDEATFVIKLFIDKKKKKKFYFLGQVDKMFLFRDYNPLPHDNSLYEWAYHNHQLANNRNLRL